MALQQVFLSSSYFDMKDTYRPAAMQAIQRAGAVPLVMEAFGANPERVDSISLKKVDAADLFVLLVGFRYGSLLFGHSKSVTELEYDEALQLEIPVLPYLSADDPGIVEQVRMTFPSDAIDTGGGSAEQLDRLNTFRRRLKNAHTPEYYVSPSDLARKLERDVRAVLAGGDTEGSRRLKQGYEALARGDYSAAQFNLQAAVANLREDATMHAAIAARARFLLALARLNGRRPASASLEIVRDVLALLTTAIQLDPRATYRFTFAVIALDVSRNGFPQYAEEGERQLGQAASSTMTQEDRRNLALIEQCQPALMRDLGY